MRKISVRDPALAAFDGSGVLIAVLDSGVQVPHPHLEAVAERVCIDESFDDVGDRLGHGTAVAAAIHDLAPGASLIVGKIFDRRLATNAATLARGIDWAVGRGARLINLSLGTVNPAHRELLSAAVTRAAAARAILVSAREVNGLESLPGGLPMVIGVSGDATLERDEIIVAENRVFTAPYPRPIPGIPKERNLSGVSFAVANATGIIARMIAADPALTADSLQGGARH